MDPCILSTTVVPTSMAITSSSKEFFFIIIIIIIFIIIIIIIIWNFRRISNTKDSISFWVDGQCTEVFELFESGAAEPGFQSVPGCLGPASSPTPGVPLGLRRPCTKHLRAGVREGPHQLLVLPQLSSPRGGVRGALRAHLLLQARHRGA